MDFFDNIYLSNSIKSYCIVAGIILSMLVLKKYLSKYIAILLFPIVHHFWKTVNKKKFIELLIKPLQWFLFIVISIFAMDTLNFPDQWQYKIYGHSIQKIIEKTGSAIIIVSFTWLLLKIISFIAFLLEQKALQTPNKTDDQLVVFSRDFVKVIIVIMGVLFLIKVCFNQPLSQLLTGLSIVGAALALAARESLENLIASFIIFFDKPFTTGDFLKVNTVTGWVERIGLRSTRIRTIDRTLVSVPNKQMVDSIVDNLSIRTHMRAEIAINISLKTPSDKMQYCIDETKKILFGQTDKYIWPSVYLKETSKTDMILAIEYFTPVIATEAFNRIKEETIIDIKRILEENNIEMASTSNTVTIINESKEREP